MGPLKPRNLIGCCFLVSAFSLWQMSHYNLYMGESMVVWSGFVQGLGLGLVSVPLTTATFPTLDPRLRGDGMSIYSLSRNIGSSIGISFVQTLLSRNTQIMHSSLVEHISVYNPPAQPGVLPDAWNIHTAAGLAALDAELNRQASMTAYVDNFWLLHPGAGGAAVPAADTHGQGQRRSAGRGGALRHGAHACNRSDARQALATTARRSGRKHSGG